MKIWWNEWNEILDRIRDEEDQIITAPVPKHDKPYNPLPTAHVAVKEAWMKHGPEKGYAVFMARSTQYQSRAFWNDMGRDMVLPCFASPEVHLPIYDVLSAPETLYRLLDALERDPASDGVAQWHLSGMRAAAVIRDDAIREGGYV